MDTAILEDIGLSPLEVKVFLAILELGESKAGKIIERTNLQSSSVYQAIHSLIAKGLVSYIKKSEVKYYRAADPEAVLDYIDLKKQEFLKILPELKARQKKGEEEGVEYFKSIKGIKTLHLKMLKDAQKGDVFRTFGVDDPEEYQEARERVFRFLKPLFKQKGIVTKGILSEQNRTPPSKTSRMQKKYLNVPLPPNTTVCGDKVAILSWNGEPSGILIYSSSIAKQYSAFFDALWTIAKN